MGRERDDTDAAKDIARDLAQIAHQISCLKGEANAHLRDQSYATLRLRLEITHAAVEAAHKKTVGDDRQRTPPQKSAPRFAGTSIHRLYLEPRCGFGGGLWRPA